LIEHGDVIETHTIKLVPHKVSQQTQSLKRAHNFLPSETSKLLKIIPALWCNWHYRQPCWPWSEQKQYNVL